MGCLCLGDAVGGQVCVGPGCCAVAVEEGPVALRVLTLFLRGWFEGRGGGPYIPRGRAVVALRGIMPALAVAAEEEDLVLCLVGGDLIQLVHLVVEALPLREFAAAGAVGIVGAVDEAEVAVCLSGSSVQLRYLGEKGHT